ncbi:hypothetical protein [Vibrio sp. vnigr-6D03]|uniref:hypothetical protein n=1 Tax=Vibrio sp. vnigr-6D03 TaxID=2058088 RepID=UPI0011AFCDD2|nr:hypothetical protein [Vibrio sp. vnigr-6D03]
MNRNLFAVSLLMFSSQLPSLAYANSILYDSCDRNSHAYSSTNCNEGSKKENGFEYEGSIWESDESDEPLITFMDRGRSPTDSDWEAMDIEDKVLNEQRNDCARRDANDCIIYEND